MMNDPDRGAGTAPPVETTPAEAQKRWQFLATAYQRAGIPSTRAAQLVLVATAQSVPWLAGVGLREPFREAAAPTASDGLTVADLTEELGLTPAQLRLIRDQLAAEGCEVPERFHRAGMVNRLLERIGLQQSTRDRKGRLRWILTEAGKAQADALIGTAASGPPREVHLIRWSRSVLEPLAQAAAGEG